MPLRSPVPNFATSEVSNPISVTLPAAGTVMSQSIVPTKAYGQSIVGLELRIVGNIVQSGASAWTVGALFNELKIMKGSIIDVDPQSLTQLQRLFNALTSLTDTTQPNTYFNNPSSAGASGASSTTLDVFLPLQFTTETPVVLTVGLKSYATVTNCTSGSATITVTWLYSNMKVTDDLVKIVTTPSALSQSVDIDVSQYFADSRKIKEVWYDVTADSNLNYQRFMIGSSVVFDNHTPIQVRALTTMAPWMLSYAGFMAAVDMAAIYPPTGATAASKPQLIMNLSASISPTFYLFIQQ